MKQFLSIIIFVSNILFLSAQEREKNSILYFSPEGIVKGVSQVKVGFQNQMVPFGDPRAKTDIFEIDCPVPGKARWIDEKTFVYEFPNQLEAGINCKFKIKQNIKTLAGKDLTGKKTFTFSTGGPAIVSKSPYEGQTIDEDQIFILTIDTEVNESTLTNNLYFEVEGIKDKVQAKILDKNSYKEILKTTFGYGIPEAKKIIMVQATKKFASNTKISLVWNKGISSKSGVLTDIPQVIKYSVRSPFVVEFSCDRENAKAFCIPFSNMYISFSAPISKSEAKKIILESKNKKWSAKLSSNETEEGEENDSTTDRVYFEGPFPEESKFTISLPSNIKDDSDRKLSNAQKFPLEVKTDKYPPLAKFSGSFGILELEGEPLLPVSLRNLDKVIKARIIRMVKDESFFDKVLGKKVKISSDKILHWLKKVNKAGRDKSMFAGETEGSNFEIQKPNGEKAFEVVGIPLKEAGFYAIEIESDKLGESLLEKKGKLYVPTTVLVTNMSVHFKQGTESSVVWVTNLNNASPVADAKISIRDCKNTLLAEGTTDSIGIWATKVKLNSISCGFNTYDNALLVIAEKGNDLSFVHSSWNNGIENWRFNLSGYSQPDNVIVHTVLDRALFRAGETVSMKHLMRKHSLSGISFPSNNMYPLKGKIIHDGTGQEYPISLKWGDGFSESKWKIPKEAKLGSYRIELSQGNKSYSSGSFNVEEFKVPLMKALIKSPLEKLVNTKNFTLDLIINYLSGGPASGTPVKLRTMEVEGSVPDFEGFEDFSFASTKVKDGIVKNAYSDDETYGEDSTIAKTQSGSITKDYVLDKLGSIKADVVVSKSFETIKLINAEMEYRDPSGEIQTAFSSTKIYPSRYLVGLRNDSWSMPKDDVKAVAAVVDLDGKPKSGITVDISMYTRKYKSNRKRLVGGFYSYDSYTEIKKLGSFCSGKTNAKGLLECKKSSPVSGNIILQAEISEGGNSTYANKEYYISGKDIWFDVSDNDRIDLIPEKKSYEAGETAKFQVRAPFKNATVLVTVEREGILDHYVKQISSANPSIEIPIKQHYTPNVFISALVVRGRVADVKPTALIDLGRPSFKLGTVGIKIGWKPNELKVSVKTDRPVFKIREKATATISVKTANGTKLPANSDVAIAVVDEGLLELMPNTTWEILKAMMGERGNEVNTSTAQMQVVGRRHFGIKALVPGGGGGSETSRQMFDTLLFWKTSVKLDSEGNATVQIPINDSITSFKIVAIATSGEKFFGTGSTSIRTTQDLILEPGIPQLTREGDLLKPSFTVRNSSSSQLDVELSGTISGLKDVEVKKVSLEPNESKEVSWEIAVPFNVEKLEYEFTAKAGKGIMDKVKFIQKVVPAVPVRVIQGTLLQIENDFSMKVEKPESALDGRGSIDVIYSKSLLENLGSIKEYMKKYPYTCLEQQTSKAIVLKDKKSFDTLMGNLPAYLDMEGFARYFPGSENQNGSPTLTSYILSISNEAGYSIPEQSRNAMLNALGNFVEGKVYRDSSLQTADLTIRKINAMETLSRYNKLNIASLSTISLDFNLLPTSAILDYWNILSRTQNAPKRAEQISQVEQILRARLNLQGSTMKFTNEKNDSLWWLMTSPDMNATKLLLSLVNLNKWREDIPRILRGTISRQQRGVWDITTANAWGSLALEKFSKEFEKESITGETTTSLADKTKSLDWTQKPKGETHSLPFGKSQSELKITHSGSGKPWATIQSKAAIPLKSAVSSGYTIEKTIKQIDGKGILGIFSNGYKRNDLLRVTIKIKADADMTWVVVTDPIPTGAAILGGIRKDSSMAQSGQQSSGSYPTFEERSYESYRAYYEYLPEGETIIEYTIRLNQDGTFSVPPLRVEAMYSPDMYGEFPNPIFEIGKE